MKLLKLFGTLAKIATNKATIVVVLVTISSILGTGYVKERGERKRHQSNNKIMIDKLDAEKKTSARALILKAEEFNQYLEHDQRTIEVLKDSLGIALKDVKELTQLNSESKVNFTAKLVEKDMLIGELNDRISQSQIDELFIANNEKPPEDPNQRIYLKHFEWSDEWLDFYGYTYKNAVAVDYTSVDTIDVVVHPYKNSKWFLPKLFEKAKIKTSVANRNPRSKITINERIIVK